jgi:hypothetical protein
MANEDHPTRDLDRPLDQVLHRLEIQVIERRPNCLCEIKPPRLIIRRLVEIPTAYKESLSN